MGVAELVLILGLFLLALNLYGLNQPLRKPGLGVNDHESLRFIPERVWSYEESLNAINSLNSKQSGTQLLSEANRVVNRSLVHVDWDRVDPDEYRQRVPAWENYFLYAMGKFSGLPQFERYHYADYLRNIRRGIGICGDAATVLSSILDRHGVANHIISFDGHVIVEAESAPGREILLDPDLGVVLGVPLDSLSMQVDLVRSRYIKAGYTTREVNYLMSIYQTNYRIFDDTFHFMSKRFLFEEASYLLKWPFPMAMVVAALWYIVAARRKSATARRR